jgi:hypothetical protein
VSDEVFSAFRDGVTILRHAAWHIANCILPLRTYSDDSMFVRIRAGESLSTIVMSDY